MNNNSKDQFDKRIDVELKKKELEKKYDAHFGKVDQISPEVEIEWLNYIEKFEQLHEDVKMIKVYEYIGKPAYRKIEDIYSTAITGELNNLLNFLNEKNVSLDTLCMVDEKELYRFITEELFWHEIEDVHIDGMMTCFIYEEFHPNAEYDILSAHDYFFRMTMAKVKNIGGEGYDLLYIDTENYLNSTGDKLDKKEAIKRINALLDSFDYFEIVSNEIKNISINEEKNDARLTFDIEYRGCFNNSSEVMHYKGKGCFRLRPSKYGGWNIYHIDLPGWRLQ